MTAKPLFGLVFLGLSLAGAATAAPALKPEVTVNSGLVMVADMFVDAGELADKALFRAPPPGTAGLVSLEEVRTAALRIGLTTFDDTGLDRVRVSRPGTVIDETLVTSLLTADLRARGILTEGMSLTASIATPLAGINADAVAEAAQITGLRYLPASGAFTARLVLAGHETALELAGHLDLLIEAPHLVASLPVGSILSESDFEMRPVQLNYAEANGYASPDQLIGKQLRRQTRAGVALRPGDVTEAHLVSRNDLVTIYFRNGPLTLTVKGQALGAAAKGETVSVLNLMSKRVLHGIVTSDGAVEVTSRPMAIAGL